MDVRWFFVDTTVTGPPSLYMSHNWESDPPPLGDTGEVGEIWGSPRVFDQGDDSRNWGNRKGCPNAEWFAIGAPADAPALKLHRDGVPVCCRAEPAAAGGVVWNGGLSPLIGIRGGLVWGGKTTTPSTSSGGISWGGEYLPPPGTEGGISWGGSGMIGRGGGGIEWDGDGSVWKVWEGGLEWDGAGSIETTQCGGSRPSVVMGYQTVTTGIGGTLLCEDYNQTWTMTTFLQGPTACFIRDSSHPGIVAEIRLVPGTSVRFAILRAPDNPTWESLTWNPEAPTNTFTLVTVGSLCTGIPTELVMETLYA